MSWIGLDDGLLEHPKFIRAVNMAGSEAVHLWLGLRAYCARYLTDGGIPADMVDEVRGPRGRKRQEALAALVHVGLIEQRDGALYMHDYLDWSESRDSVLRKRASARERQAKSRTASQRDSARSIAELRRESQDPSPSPSPILSIPDPPVSPPSGDGTPTKVRKPKAPAPQTWRRFPRDWNMTDSCRALASELGLSLAAEHAKILDHEFKTPHSDPEATMRNWLRESAERRAGRPGLSPVPPGLQEHKARQQAEAEAKAAEWFRRQRAKEQAQ